MNTILDLRNGSYSFVNSINTKQENMYYNIKTCGYFLCNDSYGIERHELNELLLLVTLKGTGYLEYRGQSYTLTAKKGFIIDCNEHQNYYSDKNNLWEFVWIHFTGSHSREYYNEVFLKYGPIFIDNNNYVKNKILDIHHLIKEKNINTDIHSSKIVIDIFTKLLITNHEEKYLQIPEVVYKAKNYIDMNYSQKVYLEDICKLIGISKSYLIRQFKNYTAFSPYEYLLNIRLKEAKSLLIHTNKPISEIAILVGFDSPSHFVKYFKKAENITPLKYRQHWR